MPITATAGPPVSGESVLMTCKIRILPLTLAPSCMQCRQLTAVENRRRLSSRATIHEYSPAAQTAFAANRKFRALGKPISDRNRKSSFWSTQHCVRKAVQWAACHFGLAVRQWPHKLGRQSLDQFMIDKWDADFERMRHACPVGISQETVPEIPVHFQRENLRIAAGEIGDRVAKRRQQIERFQSLRREFGVENLVEFPRHE